MRFLAEKAGHNVIEWEPIDHPEIVKLVGALFTADGGKKIGSIIENGAEPWPAGLLGYKNQTKQMELSKLWEIQARRYSIARDLLARWNATVDKTGVSVCICL